MFFDHRAQTPAHFKGQTLDFQWHKTAPVLAVASESDSNIGLCNLYREEVSLLVSLLHILSFCLEILLTSSFYYFYCIIFVEVMFLNSISGGVDSRSNVEEVSSAKRLSLASSKKSSCNWLGNRRNICPQ